MKEINGVCPRCNQHRLLRSINYLGDRRHGITISKDEKYVDYLCYSNCLNEIDKGIKNGKGIVELIGVDFVIHGHALPKYLERIHNELQIEKQTLRKSWYFMNFTYSRWVEIQPKQKFAYHLASLVMLLRQSGDEKQNQLENYIVNTHFTNSSLDKINNIINEIVAWCQRKNFNPFN